jgi:hypothetical protein
LASLRACDRLQRTVLAAWRRKVAWWQCKDDGYDIARQFWRTSVRRRVVRRARWWLAHRVARRQQSAVAAASFARRLCLRAMRVWSGAVATVVDNRSIAGSQLTQVPAPLSSSALSSLSLPSSVSTILSVCCGGEP